MPFYFTELIKELWDMKQPDGWCAGSLGRECGPGLDLAGSRCCGFGQNTLLSKCLSPPGV